ncbi:hypothetical protein PUN28_018578 [Cardiocondyla obscurior]|uniref:Uncharacterized protein n=1 Tax=Cardiocondyla obscurior TaxID=286306 RepID=A0AAW2EK05_9HYME
MSRMCTLFFYGSGEYIKLRKMANGTALAKRFLRGRRASILNDPADLSAPAVKPSLASKNSDNNSFSLLWHLYRDAERQSSSCDFRTA